MLFIPIRHAQKKTCATTKKAEHKAAAPRPKAWYGCQIVGPRLTRVRKPARCLQLLPNFEIALIKPCLKLKPMYTNCCADSVPCSVCGDKSRYQEFVLCDACHNGQHTDCAGLAGVPEGFWTCPDCMSHPGLDSAICQVGPCYLDIWPTSDHAIWLAVTCPRHVCSLHIFMLLLLLLLLSGVITSTNTCHISLTGPAFGW